MSETNGTQAAATAEVIRDEWVSAVNDLVARVEGWAKEFDWVTRRSSKRFNDKRLGSFELPMLLMQQWDARLLLNPSSRFIAGDEVDGRVDLSTMPEYDDVAVLLRQHGGWVMRVQLGREERDLVPFNRDSFKDVIETFARRHAETPQ